MLNSTQAFLDTLEQWVKAIRQDDFVAAMHLAQRLIQDGELLAEDPEFRDCFARHGAGSDTRQALVHLCQFLLCATSGRARILKEYIDAHRPPSP